MKAKTKNKSKKKPLTVIELARMGGKARARSMSKERRREIAVNAIKTRWANFRSRQAAGQSNEALEPAVARARAGLEVA